MFGTAAPHNHPRHHMASGHIALAFRTSLAPCSGPKKVLWRGCFVPHAFCTSGVPGVPPPSPLASLSSHQAHVRVVPVLGRRGFAVRGGSRVVNLEVVKHLTWGRNFFFFEMKE